MKVSELIAELNTMLTECGDLEIIIQKDGEGNGYSPLEGLYGPSTYRPDSTWSGEIVDDDIEDSDDSEVEFDVVLLVPVN